MPLHREHLEHPKENSFEQLTSHIAGIAENWTNQNAKACVGNVLVGLYEIQQMLDLDQFDPLLLCLTNNIKTYIYPDMEESNRRNCEAFWGELVSEVKGPIRNGPRGKILRSREDPSNPALKCANIIIAEELLMIARRSCNIIRGVVFHGIIPQLRYKPTAEESRLTSSYIWHLKKNACLITPLNRDTWQGNFLYIALIDSSSYEACIMDKYHRQIL